MPVGLFGEQTNVIAGSASVTTRRTSARSSDRSGARLPTATSEPAIFAIWLCMA
jgi:hypothetical protein